MKTRMSKILSILLVFALIVSAGDVVHAEDADGQKAEAQEMAEVEETEPEAEQKEDEPEIVVAPVEDEAEAEEPVAEDKKEIDAQESSEAEADVSEEAQAEQELEAETDEAMDVSDVTKMLKTKAGTYYNSKPIVCSAKGVVVVAVNCTKGNCYYGVFKDATLDTKVSDAPGYVSASTGSATKCFTIPQAGTYYIGVYTTSTAELSCAYDGIFYDGSDRTVTNGQTIAVGQKNAQTNYFAFKAVATGYLTPQGNATARNYRVALCNSAKSPLSSESYLGNAPTYGVKAGTTYYIRVTSSYNSQGAYAFKVTNSKVSEKSGKTKKKAVNVKKKKTKSGMIEAGSAGKQADWYKFKVTKKKKVKISVTTNSNDAMKIVIYKGGKKISSRTIYQNTDLTIESKGKWPKGTYYIKIQRANATSSGYYSLKWS